MTPTTPDEVVTTPDDVQTPDAVETPEQRAERLGWHEPIAGDWAPPGVHSIVRAWASYDVHFPRGVEQVTLGVRYPTNGAALTAALDEWEGLSIEGRARISGWQTTTLDRRPLYRRPDNVGPWLADYQIAAEWPAWLASLRKPAAIPAEVAPDDVGADARTLAAIREVVAHGLRRLDPGWLGGDLLTDVRRLHSLADDAACELDAVSADLAAANITVVGSDYAAGVRQLAAQRDARSPAAARELDAVDAALGLTGPWQTRYEDQRATNIRALQRERDAARKSEAAMAERVAHLHAECNATHLLASDLRVMGVELAHALAARDRVTS